MRNIDWTRIRTQAMDPDGPLRRMWPLYTITLISLLVTLPANPLKAGLLAHGIGKVLLGGLLGYVVDRCVFRPEDRPHLLAGIERGTAWKRRAWIVCAAIIAVAVGVP